MMWIYMQWKDFRIKKNILITKMQKKKKDRYICNGKGWEKKYLDICQQIDCVLGLDYHHFSTWIEATNVCPAKIKSYVNEI